MRSEMNMISGGRKKKMKSKVFAETCSKMRQFLKERRSLGDQFAFHNIPPSSSMLEINGAKEMHGPTNTTMNLFPKNIEKEGNVSTGQNLKSLDLFPSFSSSSDVTAEESAQNVADYRELPKTEEEPKTTTACMTIFYGGRVVVFDDMPEDKAHEIMSMASLGVINSQSQTQTLNNTVITGQPMPRRLSLHRFLEKRKDRIATTAPYLLDDMFTKNHEKYNSMRKVYQRQEQEFELKLF